MSLGRAPLASPLSVCCSRPGSLSIKCCHLK
jgi:hypothetical protein